MPSYCCDGCKNWLIDWHYLPFSRSLDRCDVTRKFTYIRAYFFRQQIVFLAYLPSYLTNLQNFCAHVTPRNYRNPMMYINHILVQEGRPENATNTHTYTQTESESYRFRLHNFGHS